MSLDGEAGQRERKRCSNARTKYGFHEEEKAKSKAALASIPASSGQKRAHGLQKQAVRSPCWPVSGLTELQLSPSQALIEGAQWLE